MDEDNLEEYRCQPFLESNRILEKFKIDYYQKVISIDIPKIPFIIRTSVRP